MNPVFIFGTGRCGSTYLQRLITLRTTCWIWGEHDGFLAPLLAGVRRYEDSAAMDKNVFQFSSQTDSQLLDQMINGSVRLPWLNRLDRAAIGQQIGNLIDNMFRRGMPAGWSDWGFKEILYGLGNDAPDILLEIFPKAKAIFSFRAPQATISSMVVNWTPQLIKLPLQSDALTVAYRERTQRWLTITRHFLQLKPRVGDRITFACADLLDVNEQTILDAMRLERRNDSLAAQPIGVTNSGARSLPAAAQALLDELFSRVRQECSEIYEQAIGTCEQDLAIQRPQL